MKKALITIFILFPFISISQPPRQKLSKDSVAYYKRQLNELSKATYDSMVNTASYKEIVNKLNPKAGIAEDNFGVELTFFSGVQINNYSNLNSRLRSLNIKEKKTGMLPFGIGLALRFNKVIVGYDMTPTMIGDLSTGDHLHIYISTNVIRTKGWIFSPQVGYGVQGVRMRVPTPSSATDFNSYFLTSANQVEIKYSNSVLDFGIALKALQKNKASYIPLFRFGYRYGLNGKAWEIVNGNSNNAPIDRNSNFYFHLMLGFGD